MPLKLEGCVELQISDNGTESDTLRIDARDLTCKEGGVRVVDGGNRRHEFLFAYVLDPRVELEVSAIVIDGVIELDSKLIEKREGVDAVEEGNTLLASFDYDPDRDDEPLTPVSSN
ncbi:MAG: hypothetical protein UMU75_00390 [Halomonas sp.]|nr:hypothetical protein [Halomonas sp.]